ncbi:thioredoxin-like protein 4B [Salvia splendens]|uniref:thioredoxin-like protein 4B n=1 Tax=Salvia splendens TaxID=180675 RepID=UPI001C25E606|nr:thioredoxin-like protein 4B [Salvia splendens]
MEYLLPTLRKKQEVDSLIKDTLDKVLVLRFGLSSDVVCLQLDDVLYKSAKDVSKFATVALVDAAAEEIQVYLKYFDITYVPSIVFFFNAHHMKMDSGSADHCFLPIAEVQITLNRMVHFRKSKTLWMLGKRYIELQ